MTVRRLFTLLAAVVVTAAFVQAQGQNGEHAQNTQPAFKGHQIGESVQAFFSIAKMAGKNGVLSTDFCHSYLDDPKVKKTVERAKRKATDNPAILDTVMTVEGCNHIRQAVAGQDVEVDARFADEFGSGTMQFVGGHLGSVSFVVKAPFNDVMEDMTAKLNAKPQLGMDTFQNSVAAIVNQHTATWTLPNTLVRVSESESLDGGYDGAEVSVSDPAMMKHRVNSLN